MRNSKFDSIGQVALRNQGNTTGFDYLRLGLSLGVVLQHCADTSNEVASQWVVDHKYAWFFILPAFFALSGYLVTGSLLRNSIPQFILLRVIRIVPALAVEVILSATLLGVAFTTLPLGDYLSSTEFQVYFLNILGDIHFTLPGVFKGHYVNLQLWTIPLELRCYALLVGVGVVTLTLNQLRRYFPYALLAVGVALTFWYSYHCTPWDSHHFSPRETQYHVSGMALEVVFVWACVIYLFKDYIPYNAPLGIACILLGIFGLRVEVMQFFALIPLAYGTVYIGLMRLPRIRFGDLSYGLYLFHYPFMQMLHMEAGINSTLLLSAITIIASGLFALVSWNFLEKPVLDRKKTILAWMAALEQQFFLFVRRRVPS